MADPVIVECASACTVTLQLEQIGPFSLSAEDGLILSGLVISMWFAGFAIRAVMRAISGDQGAST